MANLALKKQIADDAKSRMKTLSFGDPVTNICAGEGNPHRHAWFAELKIKRHKNRYGAVHSEYLARCTDKKGKFFDTHINVIYPGHLPPDVCKELFYPVWQASFGNA